MYICGIKENYNHENRHKYYLKCHLIFCIKYRRKILKGEFDDNIKAIFQSIADDSDFDIDIMETDKDHIHFIKRSVNPTGRFRLWDVSDKNIW